MAFRKPRQYGFRCGTCLPDDSFRPFPNSSLIFLKFGINSRTRIKFYETINRQQSFPFQNPLINYIAKHPASPKVYQKLIKSCKYFFDKNPILVVSNLSFEYYSSGWHISWNGIDHIRNKILSKYWVNEEIHIKNFAERNGNQHHLDFIIPKIFQVNISKYSLTNQNIGFNNFMLLAAKCDEILLENVIVKNDDGSIVALEELIKNLPNVKIFQYEIPRIFTNIIQSETVQNLMKIPHFSNLEKFKLYEIPEIFDLDNFYGHIKKNIKTNFYLNFRKEISEELKNRILVIGDEADYPEISTYIGYNSG